MQKKGRLGSTLPMAVIIHLRTWPDKVRVLEGLLGLLDGHAVILELLHDCLDVVEVLHVVDFPKKSENMR